MLRFIIILLLSTSLFIKANGQDSSPKSVFAEKMVLGTSLTYIFDYDTDNPKAFYHELTWHKNIAVSLSNQIYVGLSYLNIYTLGSIVEQDSNRKLNYQILGAFGQYHLDLNKKTSLFGELSINIGDYCTCGDYDMYRKSNLKYIGTGLGYQFKLYKSFYLDLAFSKYFIANKVKQKYSYTQYIIGLNYILSKKNRH